MAELVGWAKLEHWGNASILDKFKDGIVNDVRLVELNGERFVARLGSRSEPSLLWERDLLEHLGANGLRVPRFVASLDGRYCVDGLVVMEYMEGRAPESDGDWAKVVEYLETVHKVTADWAQRPGFVASVDLVHDDTRSSIVDTTSIPPESLALMRSAWSKLVGTPTSVVHGDPNPTNIRIGHEGVALVDWDESRLDASALDMGGLCWGEAIAHNFSSTEARNAFTAWDAAVCWDLAPEYARGELKKLRGP